MTMILKSIQAEYRRYKALADSAMAQLSETELGEPGPSLTLTLFRIRGRERNLVPGS